MMKVEHAPFVKLCDRIANIEYSKQTNDSMFEKYKKEHKLFVARFPETIRVKLKPMFDHLDSLFQ